jgi:hypothetical protein
MQSPNETQCPHCKRRSAALVDRQRCEHCGAVVCGDCATRIAEIDQLLADNADPPGSKSDSSTD